ncbi:MAG: hypothetical protein LBL32_00160 [Holosporales bacterium]|nr:hypothetical protein [Holosporales bacterium]
MKQITKILSCISMVLSFSLVNDAKAIVDIVDGDPEQDYNDYHNQGTNVVVEFPRFNPQSFYLPYIGAVIGGGLGVGIALLSNWNSNNLNPPVALDSFLCFIKGAFIGGGAGVIIARDQYLISLVSAQKLAGKPVGGQFRNHRQDVL